MSEITPNCPKLTPAYDKVYPSFTQLKANPEVNRPFNPLLALGGVPSTWKLLLKLGLVGYLREV